MLIRRMGAFLRSLLLPNGVIAAAGAVSLARGTVPADLAPSLPWVFYGLASAAALLGVRFHRSRVALTASLLAAAQAALVHLPPGLHGRSTLHTVWLLLPLLVTLVAMLPERGLLNRYGLAQILLLLFTITAAAVGVWKQPEGMLRWLEEPLFPPLPPWAPDLPHATLVAFTLALLTLLVCFARRRGSIESGLFWVVATLAAGRGNGGAELAGWFLLGCFLLLLSLLESFHFLAFRDELTGLPARRALNEAMNGLGGRYTLAMVDIDHFKKVNDRHGHDVGDQVLRMVAARLTAAGTGARIYRYGGEEFTVSLPGRTVEEALPDLEILRAAVAATPFRVRGPLRLRGKRGRTGPPPKKKKSLRVTVSIGAAGKVSGEEPLGVLKRADKALYRAKKAGRNRVCKAG